MWRAKAVLKAASKGEKIGKLRQPRKGGRKRSRTSQMFLGEGKNHGERLGWCI